MHSLINQANKLFQSIDFLGPLAIRLYLAMIFWSAGMRKFESLEGFAGLVEHLGFPVPIFFAFLAALTEVLGAVALLFGFGVRYFAFALLVTMAVAALVHIDNGFLAIADGRDAEIAHRLALIDEIITKYGYREWLLAKGNIGIIQNGVQFVMIYSIMLLSLIGSGGGRLLSVDYYLGRKDS